MKLGPMSGKLQGIGSKCMFTNELWFYFVSVERIQRNVFKIITMIRMSLSAVIYLL